MSNYTHLNNIAVQGSIESSAQGKLIGSFDTMPAASSLNAGQIVLYTGATGTYVQGKYYVSNGTSWVISAASPSAVTVDSALSDTSTNPVQNKVIKAALDAKVPAVSGKGLSTNDYTTAEKTKLSGIEAGAQVNKITDVTVNGTTVVGADKVAAIDLSNYATKGDVSAIPKFAISVVSSLPTSDISTSTIYLKSNGGSSGNSYDEYLYVNGAWEKIGTTEVDLSGYVPKTRKVNNKALSTDITLTAGDVGALPAGGTAVKATADANGNNIANTYATQTALTNGLAAKQNALTFDSAPTSGSSNPVTSGGVFSAINTKQDKLTFDQTPTENSVNPVTSGGVYNAINAGSGAPQVIDIATSFDLEVDMEIKEYSTNSFSNSTDTLFNSTRATRYVKSTPPSRKIREYKYVSDLKIDSIVLSSYSNVNVERMSVNEGYDDTQIPSGRLVSPFGTITSNIQALVGRKILPDEFLEKFSYKHVMIDIVPDDLSAKAYDSNNTLISDNELLKMYYGPKTNYVFLLDVDVDETGAVASVGLGGLDVKIPYWTKNTQISKIVPNTVPKIKLYIIVQGIELKQKELYPEDTSFSILSSNAFIQLAYKYYSNAQTGGNSTWTSCDITTLTINGSRGLSYYTKNGGMVYFNGKISSSDVYLPVIEESHSTISSNDTYRVHDSPYSMYAGQGPFDEDIGTSLRDGAYIGRFYVKGERSSMSNNMVFKSSAPKFPMIYLEVKNNIIVLAYLLPDHDSWNGTYSFYDQVWLGVDLGSLVKLS